MVSGVRLSRGYNSLGTASYPSSGIFGQCRNASTEDRDSDNDDDDEDDDVAIINARRAERESSASSG